MAGGSGIAGAGMGSAWQNDTHASTMQKVAAAVPSGGAPEARFKYPIPPLGTAAATSELWSRKHDEALVIGWSGQLVVRMPK